MLEAVAGTRHPENFRMPVYKLYEFPSHGRMNQPAKLSLYFLFGRSRAAIRGSGSDSEVTGVPTILEGPVLADPQTKIIRIRNLTPRALLRIGKSGLWNGIRVVGAGLEGLSSGGVWKRPWIRGLGLLPLTFNRNKPTNVTIML